MPYVPADVEDAVHRLDVGQEGVSEALALRGALQAEIWGCGWVGVCWLLQGS